MKKKFYITTPIYYINAKPHIGSAYPTVVADVLARYHRLLGDDVVFLTGTDENSQKNVQASITAGEHDVNVYLDRMSAAWQMTWDTLGISNDDFIRTTEPRHHQSVVKFFHAVQKSGDIYQGEYEGFYCIGCEAFITEKELVAGNCPDHQKPPVELKEKNYFFRASRYRDQLIDHITAHPEFIEPTGRRNEVLSYIKTAFGDVSISRGWKTDENVAGVTVGIPVPGDSAQALYVWFDALINYLTGVGYGKATQKFAQYWPADVHIVGKEIIKFHCALWPAMLLSAGLPLPKKVFAHGWLTVDGQKMSKTLGNVVDPLEIVGWLGVDPLRYFLLREFSWGNDGDFSHTRLKERYQADLANGLGNVSRRILTLGEKMLAHNKLISADHGHFSCKLPSDHSLCHQFNDITQDAWLQYHDAFQRYQPDQATQVVWSYIQRLDEHLERIKPWELKQEHTPEQWSKALYPFLEGLRHLSWMLRPILPMTSERLLRSLGVWMKESKLTFEKAQIWGTLSTKGMDIDRGKVLFARLETK
ncbi:methionine--tRNA ligase [Candidatus Uhrbacteria bacterium]|nr:methionine--tRNA ligase [Candidatus Uhrbacteria bacterium]